MAARLTDKQKKKIIADYTENGSYRATARMNGVSTDTVKRIVLADGEIVQKATQKKNGYCNGTMSRERIDTV